MNDVREFFLVNGQGLVVRHFGTCAFLPRPCAFMRVGDEESVSGLGIRSSRPGYLR